MITLTLSLSEKYSFLNKFAILKYNHCQHAHFEIKIALFTFVIFLSLKT